MNKIGRMISIFIGTMSIVFVNIGYAQTKSDVANNEAKCVVKRAVFELGSGGTTVATARVNKCANTIVTLGNQVQKSMPYQTYINTSADRKTLPEDAIKEGITKIQEAKKELGIDCSDIKCVGIATAAMRNAKNADIALEEIYKTTKVKVSVISQKEEGLIGYYSAVIKANLPAKKQETAIVLDIGGGSYQVVYPDQSECVVYSGMVGSAIFRAMVIELVKSYSLHETSTPNPMTQHEIEEAKLLAIKAIGEPIIGVEQIKHLLQNPNKRIYGVGSFLKGMAKLCNKNTTEITIDAVESTIKQLTLKSDDYIANHYKGFPYVNEMVTDLIFIHGIMKVLNIEILPIIDTNNTLGTFVLPKYW